MSIATVFKTWVGSRLEVADLHARRGSASLLFALADNRRAVQILLGHTKIESTVRYLGVDVEDASTLAEGTEV